MLRLTLVFVLLVFTYKASAEEKVLYEFYPYDQFTVDLFWDGWHETPGGMDMQKWRNRGIQASLVFPFKSEGPGVTFAPGLSLGNHNYFSDVYLWHFNEEGDIREDQIIPDTADSYKNKLSNTYLEVPLELQYLPGTSSLYSFTWGIRAGYLIDSKTKYRASGVTVKIKTRENRTPYRLSSYFRISRGSWGIYGQAVFTPLFDHRNSPDIYTFSAGISRTIW